MARRMSWEAGRYRDQKRLAGAWLLFLVTLFLLWVTFNALFMVPGERVGHYDLVGISVAVVSTVIALLVAWASSRLFISANSNSKKAHGGVLSAPPMMVCIMALLVFIGLFSLKLL